jgi:hypothetical protein
MYLQVLAPVNSTVGHSKCRSRPGTTSQGTLSTAEATEGGEGAEAEAEGAEGTEGAAVAVLRWWQR